MAVFLYHVVGDLTVGKPELEEFSETETVEAAIRAIGESTEGGITVWKKKKNMIENAELRQKRFIVEGAAKRAEEVGFVDVAHFPELPMPDILHGLQNGDSRIFPDVNPLITDEMEKSKVWKLAEINEQAHYRQAEVSCTQVANIDRGPC